MPKNNRSDVDEKGYKELSAELALLLERLESGELDIDEAVECYRRGIEVVKALEKHLKSAENTVSELKSALEQIEEEE